MSAIFCSVAQADAPRPYHYFISKHPKEELHLLWQHDGERFGTIGALKDWLEAQGKTLRFATNAGMYDPSYAPLGLYIENSTKRVPLNLDKGEGNFFLNPGGVFYVDDSGAHIADKMRIRDTSHMQLATQSGPMLVKDGAVNHAFLPSASSRFIRSGVGIMPDGSAVFIISENPMTFYDFAHIFRDGFKCRDALYLDGHISKMYAPQDGQYDTDGDFVGMIAAY